MFERIKALMERWNDIKEISAMTDRDLDDLGMTRDQVQRFARMPKDISERVSHMGAVFGLSDAELRLNHEAYLELLSTCGACRDRARCSHVLAQGSKARAEDAGFCLNAEAFTSQAAQPAA